MQRRVFVAAILAFAFVIGSRPVSAQQPAGQWQFLASGDSRNCGDVVMPGIAATAQKNNVAFYWHLGDLRAIYNFDEDIVHQPDHIKRPLSISDYETIAWQDFIDSQIVPFGTIPFMIGIGNHETFAPLKTRTDYLLQFADWLDTPTLHAQRLLDNPNDHTVKTYYHWIDRGISFYNLDNATPEQFDGAQVHWFEQVLGKDLANPAITTIVAGMHEALPDSVAADHSMSDFPVATQSGRRVYADLLRAQNEGHKHVYVLASHSHFLMDGVFESDYWKAHGGVLPGWIVGTAGAVRYALPKKLPEHFTDEHIAETNIYGSLLGTVLSDGEINFAFQKLSEADVPAAVARKYGADFVHWCFAENTEAK